MSNGNPLLVYDDRQDESLVEAIANTGYFHLVKRHLITADYVWGHPTLGEVGVEDKEIHDLTGSRLNGRLDDQLRRLVERFAVPVLFVRGTTVGGHADRYGWEPSPVENLLLGRQLHGLYVYRAPGSDAGAADSLVALHRYLLTAGNMEGVRREKRLTYKGALSARAEVIYNVLGQVPGIKNRRGLAAALAQDMSVAQFLRSSRDELTFYGLSAYMAGKVADAIHTMEAT